MVMLANGNGNIKIIKNKGNHIALSA